MYSFLAERPVTAACERSLALLSGGPSPVAAAGASSQGLLSLRSTGARARAQQRGARASALCARWSPPGPGAVPASHTLAGGFLTTGPPRESRETLPLLSILS